MRSVDRPPRIPLAFAANGARNVIPAASQIAIKAGAASLADGFPPLCMTPRALGGVAPFEQDMNGILYTISVQDVWLAAGGLATFDAAFAAAIGGYPMGAVLASATVPGVRWASTVDNNGGDPGAGAPNWMPLARTPAAPRAIFSTFGDFTWTCPDWVFEVTPHITGSGGAGSNGTLSNPGNGGGGGSFACGPKSVVPGTAYGGRVGLGGGVGVPSTDTTFLGMTAGPGGNASSTSPGRGGVATGALITRGGGFGSYGWVSGSTSNGGVGGASATLYGPNTSANTPGPPSDGADGGPGQGGTGGPNGKGGNGGAAEVVLWY